MAKDDPHQSRLGSGNSLWPRLYWLAIAIGLWAGVVIIVGIWLSGSGIAFLDVDTWLTPTNELTANESKSAREIRIEELRNLFGALVVFFGSLVGAVQIGNSLHRTHLLHSGRESDQERLSAEIYSKAVEQLGSDKSATRLGAIYSLEALAISDQSSGETHLTGQIMETLASFVRERSDAVRDTQAAAERTHLDLSPPDIAAAFAVLTRSYPYDLRPTLQTGGVDLRRAYLVGVRLYEGTDLRSFNLSGAQLNKASLYGCDLSGIWLSGGDLTDARLTKARVDQVFFTNTSWGDCRGLTEGMVEDVASAEGTHWPHYLKITDSVPATE